MIGAREHAYQKNLAGTRATDKCIRMGVTYQELVAGYLVYGFNGRT